MDDGVVDREYAYRGRAPLLVLIVVWSAALASLWWAATDHGPFRGGDGRVTVAGTPASVVRWSLFGLCGLFAVYASRWAWIDRVQGRRIALSPQGIFVPRAQWAWFSVEEFIAYRDITDCRVTVVKHLGTKDGVSRFPF